MKKDEKPGEVEKIRSLINGHKVIGLLNMHKLPARQLLSIKQKLEGRAVIKMSKKTLLKKALDNSGGASVLFAQIKGEPALLLSNDNPFSLYRIIKESRSPAAAKAGDIATKDIIIQQGSTGLPPGPAISVLQKVGLKASVQQGIIAIMQDKSVCKSGDVISEEIASVLSLLKIEPMEIGLDLIAAYDGMLYKKDVLNVRAEDYINKILLAVQQSIKLSLETGFLTKETVCMSLQKAFREAKCIAVDCNLMEKEFIGDVMVKAIMEAKLLEEKVK